MIKPMSFLQKLISYGSLFLIMLWALWFVAQYACYYTSA